MIARALPGSSTRSILSGLLLLGLLGGCAAKPMVWQKAGSGATEQRTALAQCRAFAGREAERLYQRDQGFANGAIPGGQTTYQKNMTAYQVGKSSSELLSRCMKLNGYRQVPAGKAANAAN